MKKKTPKIQSSKINRQMIQASKSQRHTVGFSFFKPNPTKKTRNQAIEEEDEMLSSKTSQ